MSQKFACALFWLVLCLTCNAHGEDQYPVARQGLIDLRNTDLFTRPVALDGEWVFVPNQLLSPDSLAAAARLYGDPTYAAGLRGAVFPLNTGLTPGSVNQSSGGPPHGSAIPPPIMPDYVPYPVLWNNITLRGRQLSALGCGTYQLTILLPHKRPRLGFEVPDNYCSFRFYINGVPQAQSGIPAITKEQSVPFWTTRYVAVPSSETDTLVIVQQVANYWHARGGVYKSILIGDKDQLFLKKNREIAYDFMMGGCMFMGGLFFLALFIFSRHDKTILFFALFCIVFSYRMVGTIHYSFHAIFPNFSWFLTIRMEYLSLTLAMMFFNLYTSQLYPKDGIRLVMKTIVGICIFYSAMIMFTPTRVFTWVLIPFLGVMFFTIAYTMYVYLCAARARRSGSVFALLSTGVMLFIGLIMNLHYFGFFSELRITLLFCYIAFFFLQSLALSHRFAHTFRQAALQAQQGLKAKSEFLSTMSHEIRTPLNAVIGMTHLMLHNEPRPDQKEDLDVLLFSANNLLSIVNNILDYNKIEEGKIGFESIPMDLSAIARNIIAGLKNTAQEKGIRLFVDIDSRLDRKVLGDPTRTSQVINNLVHNAIKFTKDGWVKVSIGVEAVDAGARPKNGSSGYTGADSPGARPAKGSATSDGPDSNRADGPRTVTVTISVQDTGIGIAPEKQELIFDRFTQADSSTSRSYGGTGLGLAITRKILELQGVRLHLSSTPGEGSRFYFTQTFTFAEDGVLPDGEPGSVGNKEPLLSGICVLLVEDNPLNVLVAQTMLENNGAIVDVAVNGMEAMEKLDPSRHRIVLMDLHMPVMDGYEATALLRQRGETLPIIALTASTPKEVESEAFAAGLTDVVVKPFSPEDLFRVILQYTR